MPEAQREIKSRTDPPHASASLASRLHELLDRAAVYKWPGHGEHFEKPLDSLPDSFLCWVIRKGWHADVREMAAAVIEHRKRGAQLANWRAQIRAKLSQGALDELLEIFIALRMQIDDLADRVTILERGGGHADRG